MAVKADPRSADIRTQDSRKVKTQIRRIQDGERSRSYQRELFGRIQAIRRTQQPAGADGRRYDVAALEQGAGFLVAVTGEILVRSTAKAQAATVLGPDGFLDEELQGLRGRVTRFTKQGATVARTNELARQLRRDGIGASVNYVVPLGYVAKGEGGFEPTTVAANYRGPGAGGGGVRVAVVDTGIAAERRGDGWLVNVAKNQQNEDRLYPPGGNGQTLDFSAGHGQFTAGIIQQVAPDATIAMYRAVQSDGIGSEPEIAAAILQAGDDGAAIINLSLGTETADDAPPVGLQVALEILADEHPDVLVVAAAGNSGSTRPMWPAAFRPVVAVASLTPELKPSPWSNHGSWVDCSTVGEGVVSTYVKGDESPLVDKDQPDTFPSDAWALGTGTSFAAPQITGEVAQLMADNQGLTPRAALQRLLAPAGAGKPVPGYGMGMQILPGTPQA